MPITITLPAELEENLQAKAEAQQRPLADLIVDILSDVVESEGEDHTPDLEEVVAEIRALPPNPAAVRLATASLAELLENAPEDPTFDLARWTRQWQMIEAEMKARDRADDIAEGRL
jgi:hypothetical protein